MGNINVAIIGVGNCAIRCARLALDRGIGGALEGPSSYFMKRPASPA